MAASRNACDHKATHISDQLDLLACACFTKDCRRSSIDFRSVMSTKVSPHHQSCHQPCGKGACAGRTSDACDYESLGGQASNSRSPCGHLSLGHRIQADEQSP